jgi:peptidoglycan/xylan/chitin deacetylase (PgdA/CDA1 family)
MTNAVFTWPGDAAAAVAVTIDVDGPAGATGSLGSTENDLSAISEAEYGITRGLPRILALLDEHSIPATCYVPGETARRYPDVVRQIIDAGHEIGHHGNRHLSPARIDEAAQCAEIEQGLQALDEAGVPRPAGYRAPDWQLTAHTFALLGELGFTYDSSLMGDDRPYIASYAETSLLELPVHWTLDDWPFFGWTPDYGWPHAGQAMVHRIWAEELRSAMTEHRLVTYTMHPEVTGRPSRLTLLRDLITAAEDANLWFATHSQIADHVKGQLHDPDVRVRAS